jgi:hypothetical protein
LYDSGLDCFEARCADTSPGRDLAAFASGADCESHKVIDVRRRKLAQSRIGNALG